MYIVDPRYSPPKVYLFDSDKELKNNKYLLAFKRQTHPLTYQAIIRRAENAIDKMVSDGCGRLVWTSTGALYGYRTTQPHSHVNDFWKAISETWNNEIKARKQIDQAMRDRACNITAGSVIKCVIGRRAENWIAYKQETESHDIVTGKTIWVNEYFISNTFVPPNSKATKTTISKLQEKFQPSVS